MREFSWTNSDVIEWLQGLKDKLVSLTEVMQFFKDEFNVTKGKRAIYNHMPETTSEEVFIDKDEVLSLHSKYGNELKAIKEGDKFRVYTMKIRGIYECIDCKHVSQDERPVLLPLLFEKRGRYKLNKGVHHSICFLWTKNELLARDIDRKMREEVQANPLMKPQEAHEKGQQLALQMARSAGETGKEHDSIAIVFQSWHEVRNSYYRRRKQAATSVSDPFKPPGIYNQTYRAFVMQCEEKWLSLAEQETGVIMFASDDDYRAAAECDLLMADGTFDLCPKGFSQIYVIHGLYMEEWIALATCLMKNRLKISYAVIFKELKRKWNELSVKPSFRAFHCDYEEAEMSAAEDAFTTKKIRGCLFHYTKAIMRNINSLGFKCEYEMKDDFYKLVRMVMALPLLPKDQIVSVWKEELRDALEILGAEAFCDYFEKVWLKKTASKWNFYRIKHRTTNVCESYNSFLKRRNGALRRPGCTLLFQFLQKLQYQQSVHVLQLKFGAKPRPVNMKYKEINDRLEILWSEYEDDTANAKHDQSILPDTFKFLSAASNFLATAEKKEQKISAKKKFKAVKRWVALQTRKSEQERNQLM